MAQQFEWIGQGPIDFGIFDATNGVAEQGYIVDKTPIGCANSSLVVTVASDKIELKETCSGNRATLASVSLGNTMEVTLEMQQFSSRELAIAFTGQTTAVAGGTVTGEVLVSATDSVLAGDVVHTLHPYISSVTVYDNTNTALTAGTDYEILSADHGRIRFLTPQTGAVTIDYTYAGYDNMAALAGTVVQRGMVFNGISGTGDKVRITIPKIQWRLDGDLNWIGNEFATLTLKGEALYTPELASNTMWGGFMRIDAMPT